jgi:hypothetical protein
LWFDGKDDFSYLMRMLKQSKKAQLPDGNQVRDIPVDRAQLFMPVH